MSSIELNGYSTPVLNEKLINNHVELIYVHMNI